MIKRNKISERNKPNGTIYSQTFSVNDPEFMFIYSRFTIK